MHPAVSQLARSLRFVVGALFFLLSIAPSLSFSLQSLSKVLNRSNRNSVLISSKYYQSSFDTPQEYLTLQLKSLGNAEDSASPVPIREESLMQLKKQILVSTLLISSTVSASSRPVGAIDVNQVATIDNIEVKPKISRADVGFINLNETEPEVTDVCWLDIQIGDSAPQRIEISLYGNIAPVTADNFKALCLGSHGYGYRESDIFRIITTFTVQGGNIGSDPSGPLSKMGLSGRSALENGSPFPPENFRLLHSYKDAGVISMMKDVRTGLQDSRFFITLSPSAGWADEKYSAFGRVTNGMNFVRGLAVIPVEPPSNYPRTRVRIIDSGCYSKS